MKEYARLLTIAAGLLALGNAQAQPASKYPDHPVRLIIPFAPGGASDFAGRIIAAPLSQLWGQQVIGDNRAGAAGNIGMEVAARARPDGYTLYQGNIGTLVINPHLYTRTLKVKPLQDFAPITQVVDVPGSLVVHPSLPVKSVKELIAFAKKRPGELNFGSPGAGSANRLEMEGFMRAAGISMVHIPYKGGAGPAITGLVSGEVSLMFVTLSSSISFVQSGKLRALGVVAPHRVEAIPNVPTMAEQGFKTMTSGSWQGVLAPAGTPRPIINKIFTDLQKVMAMKEVKEHLARGGVSVVVSKSPEDFAQFMKNEYEKWGKVVRDAKVTVD